MNLQAYVLALVFLGTTSAAQQKADNPTAAKALYIVRDVRYIKNLQLDFSVPFEWQAVRGTTNLTIEHSTNYLITLSEHEDTLVISVVVTGESRPRANADCSQGDCLNLLVPGALVEDFTQFGATWPVLCRMHSHLADYSSLPSNNRLVFEDKYCTLRKPVNWDDWLSSYFGVNSGQSYFGDYDADGLVNILEYYGSAGFQGSFLTITNNEKLIHPTIFQQQNSFDICYNQFNGTDPTRDDTDGDLLLDGFETSYYMNPLSMDDPFVDLDGDTLDAMTEQSRTTDPLNTDTDGDLVADGQEISIGSDPKNPIDKEEKPTVTQYADIELTIGDWSVGHTERYILNVGALSHQSPDYGEVASGVYQYGGGSHTITIQHYGSTLETPDYDYLATVIKVSGGANVIIDDPEGILGQHNESSYFYAAGKSATMIVQNNCTTGAVKKSEVCECAKWSTCLECKADSACVWDSRGKICQSQSAWGSPWETVSGTDLCPCEECQMWYDIDNDDTTWLTNLNQQIQCPCSVIFDTYNVVPVDKPTENWVPDIACMVGGNPYCSGFHPGADGCLLSVATTSTGARQKCCYGSDGAILPPEHSGTGTPARAAEYWEHQEVDVDPFRWCCAQCEVAGYCPMYKELRQSYSAHCGSKRR